jgi:transcriptional regulator with XRE-family HTH domain
MKARREELELSLYAMAKRTGLSAEGLGKVERGQREPTWSTVQLVSEVLGLTPNDFRNPAVMLKEYTPSQPGRPRKPSPAAVAPAEPSGQKKPVQKKGKPAG